MRVTGTADGYGFVAAAIALVAAPGAIEETE
jgi:hypothetical protein